MPIIKAAAVEKFCFIWARVRFLRLQQWKSRGSFHRTPKYVFTFLFCTSWRKHDRKWCCRMFKGSRVLSLSLYPISLNSTSFFLILASTKKNFIYARKKVRMGKIYGARWQHKFDFNFSCLNREWNRKMQTRFDFQISEVDFRKLFKLKRNFLFSLKGKCDQCLKSFNSCCFVGGFRWFNVTREVPKLLWQFCTLQRPKITQNKIKIFAVTTRISFGWIWYDKIS